MKKMPTIKNILFYNIGYPGCFCERVHWNLGTIKKKYGRTQGAHTYILAANGIGKSSLIGLLLYSIRPYMADFLKGEDGGDRHISQYITHEGLNLILIEWILESVGSRNQKFLVTGYAAETNDENKEGLKKDIKELFFSFTYSQNLEKDDISFNNFLNELINESSTIRNLKKHFRILKSIRILQEINYYEQKNDWIANLSSYHIESILYRIQTKINQKEGTQQAILNFKDHENFIEKIINYAIPTGNEDDNQKFMDHLMKNFDRFKDRAYNIQLSNFFETIYNNLENYIPLLRNYEKNKKIISKMWKKINFYQYKMNLINPEIEKQYHSNQSDLIKIKNDLDSTNEKIECFNKQKLTLLIHKSTLIIDQLNKNLDKLSDSKEEIKKELEILKEIPDYRQIWELTDEIKDINNQISEKKLPILEELEKKALQYYACIINRYELLKDDEEKYSNKLKEVNQSSMKLNEQKGILNQNITNKTDEINKTNKKIEQIDKIIHELIRAKVIDSPEDPKRDLIRLEQELERLRKEIKDESKSHDSLNERYNDLIADQGKKETSIAKCQANLKNNKDKLDRALILWREVYQHPYYRTNILKHEDINDEIQYENIKESHTVQWQNKVKQWVKEKNIIQFDVENLQQIIDFYYENHYFPPNKDVTKLMDFLSDMGYDPIYGWDYITKSYSENLEYLKNISKKYPHLFDGILIGTDFEEISELVKEKLEKFPDVSNPVFISKITNWDDTATPDSIMENVIIYAKNFEEKVLSKGKERYFNRILKEKKGLEQRNQNLNREISNLNLFLDHINKLVNFLSKKDYISTKENVSILNQTINNLNQDYERIQNEKRLLNQEIQDKKTTIENLSLEKDRIQRKLITLNKNINQILEKPKLKTDKNKLEYEIDEISEQIEKLKIKQQDLNSQIQEFQKKRDDIKEKLSLERKVKQELSIEYSSKFNSLNREEQSRLKQTDYSLGKASYEKTKQNLEKNLSIKELVRRKELDKEKIENLWNSISNSEEQLQIAYEKYSTNTDREIRQIETEKTSILEELSKQIGKLENKLQNSKKEKRSRRKEWKKSYHSTFPRVSSQDIEDQPENIEKGIEDLIENLKIYKQKKEKLEDLVKKLKKQGRELKNKKELSINLNDEIGEKRRIYFTDYKRYQLESSDSYLNEFEQDFMIEHKDSVSELLINQSDFKEWKKEEENLKKVMNEIMDKIEEKVQDIQRFCLQDKYSNIQQDKIVNNLCQFTQEMFFQIEKLISGLKKRVIELEDRIKEIDDDFQTIKSKIKMKIESLYTSLIQIEKTSLPVKETSSLYKKKVFELIWSSSFEPSRVSEIIEEKLKIFFDELLEKDTFPTNLSNFFEFHMKIFFTVFSLFIDEINFLIPRPGNSPPSQKTLETMKNSSGGELTNLAILIYCLIASYRLTETLKAEEKYLKSQKLSLTLFMDNPIGKASRDDFIELQTQLAKDLNIQLFIFSAIDKAEILTHFNNIIPIAAFKEEDDGFHLRRDVLEVDKDNAVYKLHASGLTRTKPSTLDTIKSEEV